VDDEREEGVLLAQRALDESVSVGNFSSTNANNAAVTVVAGKTLAVTQSASGTFFGTLSGDGGLAKQGAAALTLSGSNSYAGGTTLSAGSLVAGNARAFGTGMITISGGTLDLGSLAINNSITNNGGSIIGAGAYAGTQAVTTGTASFSGNVGGSVVVGSGGVAMFSGTVTSLSVNTGGQALLGNGATLVQSVLINDGVLAVSQTGTTTIASAISGDGSLQQSGSGVTALTGSNAYAGPTSVDAGGLLVNGANTGLGLVSVVNAAWIGGSGSLAGGLSLAAGAKLVFDPLASLSVAGSVTLDNSFSVASLVEADGSAIDWGAIADGTYTLIGTSSTFNTIANFGAENAFSIGAGRTAYFENGSLQLVVVPEPSALALAGFGVALAGYAARRRRAG
jgi:autotransporter-associated beta strand protein